MSRSVKPDLFSASVGGGDNTVAGARLVIEARAAGDVLITFSRYPGIETRYTIAREPAAKLFADAAKYLKG